MIPSTQNCHVVRQPADWMRSIDDRILETIAEEGHMTPLALSREGLVERLDIGRKYAGMRCRLLADSGMLTRVDKGLYTITTDGRDYLKGELDASTLPDPEN